MLISGAQVLAIDKVKRDNTLTGDGQFVPLGVHSAFMKKEDADKLYQPKGNYVEQSWIKANYYTKTDSDKLYSKIGDSYTKKEADLIFQPVGDYVSATQFVELSSTIDKNFYTKKEIDVTLTKYETVAAHNNDYSLLYNFVNTTKNELSESVSGVAQDLVAHVVDWDMHLNAETKEMIEELYNRDLSKYLSTDNADERKPLNLYVENGVGSWLPDYDIIAGTGLTATDDDEKTERTLSLNEEVLALLKQVEEPIDIAEGTGIKIEEGTNKVTISAPVFQGATETTVGTVGIVPAPTAANEFLRGDGVWAEVPSCSGTAVRFIDDAAAELADDTVYFMVKEIAE